MSTSALTPRSTLPQRAPRRIVTRAWSINPTLTIFVGLALLLFAAGVVGMLIDPRMVLGMPNWAKSTKFGISLALYGATLLAILPLLSARPRLAAFVGNASGAILSLEVVLLALQAMRGVPMHFNVSTTLDATLWGIMSVSIGFFWLTTLGGVILALRQPIPDRTIAWGVRLGMLIVLIGFGQGFMMTGPNAGQLAALQDGQQLDLIGAHTVGAADGGPGLPLLGWSTQHGDLRIGHFVGIHAIQVVGLLALLLMRRGPSWLRERDSVALVWIGAASYLALVVLVTWQALRDQPLLAPDTLTALAGVLLSGVAAAVAVIWRARTRYERVTNGR